MDIVHHYVERGTGDTLILLHGNGESGDYFASQLEYFSNRFHVIAVDTRGHGGTPRGDGDFSISRFADDLATFMDERGIPSANILGFSDGGNIALVFAIRYPSRVIKLVLNGANLYPSGVKGYIQIPVAIKYRIAHLLSKISPGAKKDEELLGLMVNDPSLSPDELAMVTAPTLVIAGTKDMIKDAHTRLIAASIPGSKLSIISGDHFIAAKNPDEFNKVVDRFL